MLVTQARAPTLPSERAADTMRKDGMIGSALARLEAALRLVDDVEPPATPHKPVVAMTPAQRFQGIANFHRSTFIENTGRQTNMPVLSRCATLNSFERAPATQMDCPRYSKIWAAIK